MSTARTPRQDPPADTTHRFISAEWTDEATGERRRGAYCPRCDLFVPPPGAYPVPPCRVVERPSLGIVQ